METHFSQDEALRQWRLFAEEYTLLDEEQGTDDRTSTLKNLKAAIIRGIKAGFIEIAEDPTQGIVVRQRLKHAIQGVTTDEPLVYLAPTCAHIARAGIGRDNEVASTTRFLRLACALTLKPEEILSQLKGGDRSRMENIASLFLSA